ncbi:MAG: hypothetical protein GY842_10015 [bacterium]|nr:hypothetical protein [bacterium]
MNGEGKRGPVIIIGLAVVVLGAGGVLGGRYWLDQRAENDLLARIDSGDEAELREALLSLDREQLRSEEGKRTLEVTVERLRAMSFAEVMEVMRSDELTDEQRRHLRRVGGEVMRANMEKNVDEYFDAPKEEREKTLDRQLDEWMEFRKEMEAYREAHRDDEKEEGRERERGPRGRHTRDKQEAKERMEGGDPDRQKRRMFYFGQMRARAEARGLNMWGGRRGPGRGHGPGGGRPGGGRGG